MWVRLFVVIALTAGTARAETPDAKLRYAIGFICENTQAVSLEKDFLPRAHAHRHCRTRGRYVEVGSARLRSVR